MKGPAKRDAAPSFPPAKINAAQRRAHVPAPAAAIAAPAPVANKPVDNAQTEAPAATIVASPQQPPGNMPAPQRSKRKPRQAEPVPLPSFLRPPPKRAATTTRTGARPADASAPSTWLLDRLLGFLPERHRGPTRDALVLMRLDRPVGALLLLWPTWWALWLAADGFPPPHLLLIFTLGVFLMRSAGCVINDYADHDWLDNRVKRTTARPMAAGRVSRAQALKLFAALLGAAFVLVLFTNTLTIKLSLVGAVLAAIYPFSKRVTHLAQVVLGAAFGWSIPMAFAAVGETLPPLAWLLFLANVLFSVVYDTQYAMVDRDDDLHAGAKSTAILFGDADRVIVGMLMVTFLLAMVLVGRSAMLAWPYGVALVGSAALFGYQQWLMRHRDRDACLAAFRNNNWVGLLLWLGIALALTLF